MTDYARKLLDELMGPDRNQDRKTVKHFWDDDVCKDYLVDYCPNQLFLNTKSDLGNQLARLFIILTTFVIGICPLRHEEKMKDEYLESEEREKYRRRYEEDFYQHIQGLIRDLDRKIRRGNERINLKGDEEVKDMRCDYVYLNKFHLD